MKRFISFILMLVMVTSFVVALAEETPTTEQKTPIVIYRYDAEIRKGRIGILEVMGYEEKQPLIFQDSAENPKTDFCRLTPEEINLLPDGNIRLINKSNLEEIIEYNQSMKTSLLALETLYVYITKEDGTVERMIRTVKNSDYPKIIMYYAGRDEKNRLILNAIPYEYPILYEQYAYGLIYDITPFVRIDRVEGTTSEKLDAIFWSIAESTLPKKGNFWIPRDVAGWTTTKKSQKQIESDMEYVKQLLLNVTTEDFNDSFWKLWEIYTSLSYKFDSGEAAFVTVPAKLKK